MGLRAPEKHNLPYCVIRHVYQDFGSGLGSFRDPETRSKAKAALCFFEPESPNYMSYNVIYTYV